MDGWMCAADYIMAESTGTTRVKQEIEISCCSPSPSSGNIGQSILYSPQDSNLEYKCNVQDQHPSPGSPDRQYCSSTTSAPGDICGDSISQGTVKEDIPRRLCLVCGDIASGFHYGVASCEACKAFFKRTIQGSIEYTCPANNECEINKRRRKACQACRFQKCLLMGMLKEGVRLDRVRGGRQKYRRNPISNPYQLQIAAQSNPSGSISSLEDIKMLEVFSAIEPEILSIGLAGLDLLNRNIDVKPCIGNDDGGGGGGGGGGHTDRSCTDIQEILSILSDIFDKELVCVIGWAKQIPGFTDLPLNDQMKLLQVTWTEILTLQLAHRSIPFTGKLNFASDFWFDERLAKECDALELYNHCAQTTQRLEKLSVSKEEYYLLKSLVLSNCDVRLENIGALRKIRDCILNALNDCVFFLRHNLAIAQQQQLLLLLPSIRQADPIIRKFWINVHHKGGVTMNKLFIEMLESVSR